MTSLLSLFKIQTINRCMSHRVKFFLFSKAKFNLKGSYNPSLKKKPAAKKKKKGKVVGQEK